MKEIKQSTREGIRSLAWDLAEQWFESYGEYDHNINEGEVEFLGRYRRNSVYLAVARQEPGFSFYRLNHRYGGNSDESYSVMVVLYDIVTKEFKGKTVYGPRQRRDHYESGDIIGEELRNKKVCFYVYDEHEEIVVDLDEIIKGERNV